MKTMLLFASIALTLNLAAAEIELPAMVIERVSEREVTATVETDHLPPVKAATMTDADRLPPLRAVGSLQDADKPVKSMPRILVTGSRIMRSDARP